MNKLLVVAILVGCYFFYLGAGSAISAKKVSGHYEMIDKAESLNSEKAH